MKRKEGGLEGIKKGFYPRLNPMNKEKE